jgi:hypothetical protein
MYEKARCRCGYRTHELGLLARRLKRDKHKRRTPQDQVAQVRVAWA